MTIAIPFNKPCIVGSELIYVGQAVAGGHASGDGPFTKRAQKLLEDRFGVPRVLLTTSCTAALEMAALLCGLGPGDEVILPSYTFVSTANAVVLRGATPVFVDIRPDTLNVDERLIEAAITQRTRAIFPIHYAGVACEMDEIMAIARRHNLLVVEDAAQGVFAKYKDQWLGAIGHLGCFSFHETKNFSCGEGGALVVNDRSLEKRAEILREKGTNRSQFLRGQVDKYTWVDIGSSYAPGMRQARQFPVRKLAQTTRFGLRWWREIRAMFATTSAGHRPLLEAPCKPTARARAMQMFVRIAPNANSHSFLL